MGRGAYEVDYSVYRHVHCVGGNVDQGYFAFLDSCREPRSSEQVSDTSIVQRGTRHVCQEVEERGLV